MKPVNIAVVGAGKPNIATVNHLPAIAKSSKLNLVALCDISEGVFDYAQKYNTVAYTDYNDLIDDENVEAILIATPDWVHAEQIRLAARAGKHILCEKPVTITMEEFDTIRDAVREAKVTFQAGHVRRFSPIARKVKSLIDRGELGKVVHIRIATKGAFFPYHEGSLYRTQKTGGQFIHNGPHYVDWLCMFAGGRPVHVTGRTNRYYPDSSQAMETDNYTIALVRFDNGIIGSVEQNLTLLKPAGYPARDTIEIIGTQASLTWCNHIDSSVFTYNGRCSFMAPPYSDDCDPFLLQIEHFADCVRTGQSPQTDLNNAEDVMRICTEALKTENKSTRTSFINQ